MPDLDDKDVFYYWPESSISLQSGQSEQFRADFKSDDIICLGIYTAELGKGLPFHCDLFVDDPLKGEYHYHASAQHLGNSKYRLLSLKYHRYYTTKPCYP